MKTTTNTFYCLRYFNGSGELLGFRADSLGSLRLDWGKAYEHLSDAERLFYGTFKTKNLRGHDTLAGTLDNLNPAAAAVLRKDTTSYEGLDKAELLRLKGGEWFNSGSYSAEDFRRLLTTAEVLETLTFTELPK